MKTKFKSSIGRLISTREDGTETIGTAFLVDDWYLLTAFHVVGDRVATIRFNNPVLHPTLKFELGGGREFSQSVIVVTDCFDALADWALLKLSTLIAHSVPLPLAELLEEERGIDFETWGFASIAKAIGSGIAVDGRVTDVSAIYQDAVAYQLYSDAAGAGVGTPLNGLSGAPCIVGGGVVGIIRSNLLAPATVGSPMIAGGILYACPTTTDSLLQRTARYIRSVDAVRGLPGLPQNDLPSKPFRYLHWYGAEHAEVFFGRSKKLRDLYFKVTDNYSPAVTLVYGASGVGKSSLLAAGLIPRLSWQYLVVITRREANKSLLESFNFQLKYVEVERQSLKKPILLIFDQMEEVYTDPNIDGDKQLHELAVRVKQITTEVDSPVNLIFSFRSEWLANIRKRLQEADVYFQECFLERMIAQEIEEVVNGVNSSKRLRNFYGVKVDEGLANRIATDLLADPNSPISPVLSIILTRLWDESRAQVMDNQRLSIQIYDERMRNKLDLDRFMEEQIEAVAKSHKQDVSSGLVKDLLFRHTTDLGTTREVSWEELDKAYSHLGNGKHREHLRSLLTALNSHSLLYSSNSNGGSELMRPGALSTRLAHDTLALPARTEFQKSLSPGQRASRLLENRVSHWDPEKPSHGALDKRELDIVRSGINGMRAHSHEERNLISASERLATRKRFYSFMFRGIMAMTMVVFFSFLFYPPIGKTEVFETPAGRFEKKVVWIFQNSWDFQYLLPKTTEENTQSIFINYIETKRDANHIYLASRPPFLERPFGWLLSLIRGGSSKMNIRLPLAGCVVEGKNSSSDSGKWTGLFIIRKQISPTDEFAARRTIEANTPSIYYHAANASHPAGEYIRQGEQWIEKPLTVFKHREWCRDKEYIYLWDHTRTADLRTVVDANIPHVKEPPLDSGVKIITYVRLPVQGGKAEWSYHNPITWGYMYDVVPK